MLKQHKEVGVNKKGQEAVSLDPLPSALANCFLIDSLFVSLFACLCKETTVLLWSVNLL